MQNAEFTIRNATAASPVRDGKGLGRGVNPCTMSQNHYSPVRDGRMWRCEKSDAPNGAKDCVVGVTQGFTPLPRPGSPLAGF